MEAMKKRLQRISSRKGGVNVVMIAEKPRVAMEIAKVLSNNQQKDLYDEHFVRHEYHGKFKGYNAFFRILSVYGHIYR
jgi:DNA topoisomerase IA